MADVQIRIGGKPLPGHGPQNVMIVVVSYYEGRFYPVAAVAPFIPTTSSGGGIWQPVHTATLLSVIRRYLRHLIWDRAARATIERNRNLPDDERQADLDRHAAKMRDHIARGGGVMQRPTGIREPGEDIRDVFWHPAFYNPTFVRAMTWLIICIEHEEEGRPEEDVYRVNDQRPRQPKMCDGEPVRWRALPLDTTLPVDGSDNTRAAVVIDVSNLSENVREVPCEVLQAGSDATATNRQCRSAPLHWLLDLWRGHPEHAAMVKMAGGLPKQPLIVPHGSKMLFRVRKNVDENANAAS